MAEPLALEGSSPAYQLFMLALCIFALAILGAEAAFKGDAEVLQVLDWADNFVCAIFFIDFCLSFSRAKDRWRYLTTWSWLDLLSSIPTFEFARFGRLARIARLTRVLRA